MFMAARSCKEAPVTDIWGLGAITLLLVGYLLFALLAPEKF